MTLKQINYKKKEAIDIKSFNKNHKDMILKDIKEIEISNYYLENTEMYNCYSDIVHNIQTCKRMILNIISLTYYNVKAVCIIPENDAVIDNYNIEHMDLNEIIEYTGQYLKLFMIDIDTLDVYYNNEQCRKLSSKNSLDYIEYIELEY